ncbi:FMN-binding glutamate synthase family protein [Candidatus Gracilibacteria bacterium]|nr:FMN-binding glutamate synthase family protein [Candidatus Gracilibacteria bacterium]
MSRLAVDLQKTAGWGAKLLYFSTLIFAALGIWMHPYFHIGSGIFGFLSLVNLYYKHVQTEDILLRNFGLLAQMRYILESIGPELRQYFYASDTEERPFNRNERSEVYKKAENVDSTTSFGSQLEFDHHEIKLRHSMFPILKEERQKYSLTFGEERGLKNKFEITKPFMISAMSFGSLGENAVRSLSKGAALGGIPINTGEGGLSPYHLSGGGDVIFQLGTAKFGCRNSDGSLNEEKFKEIAANKQVRMIEIKFSQGAKPGKGGLLPKEKITKEISEIRGVPMDQDIVSPPRHIECDTTVNTVKFIAKVQSLANDKPVGIKLTLGNEKEFREMILEMKKQDVLPDYMDIDGSEGGTGAAPKSFIDSVGIPLLVALPRVQKILTEEGVRDKMKLVCSGKLINAAKQLTAMAYGADAIYTARGFMLALGCIQALQCNKGTCPVGITTHDPLLQHGLVVEKKAERIKNYIFNMDHDFHELLAATGARTVQDLSMDKLYIPDHA